MLHYASLSIYCYCRLFHCLRCMWYSCTTYFQVIGGLNAINIIFTPGGNTFYCSIDDLLVKSKTKQFDKEINNNRSGSYYTIEKKKIYQVYSLKDSKFLFYSSQLSELESDYKFYFFLMISKYCLLYRDLFFS